jgi:chromosome partitioning protein
LIKEEEEAFEKKIAYQILFTRTSPQIATKLERAIIRQLQEGSIPQFINHLNERAAYKSLFYHQLDLVELDSKEVNGLPQARDNALRVAEELVNLVVQKKEAA